MQLTGIYRATTFSPFQHAENDRLILAETTRELQRMGCRIDMISEEEVGHRPITAPVVYSMCQGPRANHLLTHLHDRGRLLINSPAAVLNCYRQNLYPLLGRDCTLVPRTRLVYCDDPGNLERFFVDGGSVWVKRGDVHSTGDGDVVKVSSLDACRRVLADFRARGIRDAAIQQHTTGQVVKFYGVVGTHFFRHYTEADRKVSRMSFSRFRPTIETVVRRMGLEVYGGDAVLTEDGQVKVIDINDWPSFASFRGEAAQAIAQRIFQLALEHTSTKVAAENAAARPVRLERR